MKKASEYRQHARECTALASQAGTEEHRRQLIAMAETWEKLADERQKLMDNAGKAGLDLDALAAASRANLAAGDAAMNFSPPIL